MLNHYIFVESFPNGIIIWYISSKRNKSVESWVDDDESLISTIDAWKTAPLNPLFTALCSFAFLQEEIFSHISSIWVVTVVQLQFK